MSAEVFIKKVIKHLVLALFLDASSRCFCQILAFSRAHMVGSSSLLQVGSFALFCLATTVVVLAAADTFNYLPLRLSVHSSISA